MDESHILSEAEVQEFYASLEKILSLKTQPGEPKKTRDELGQEKRDSAEREEEKTAGSFLTLAQSFELSVVVDERQEDAAEVAERVLHTLCEINGGGLTLGRVFGAPRSQQLPFLKQLLKNLQIWGLHDFTTKEYSHETFSLKKKRENAVLTIEEVIKNFDSSINEAKRKSSLSEV